MFGSFVWLFFWLLVLHTPGDKFDIRAFHNTILRCGAVPLRVLQTIVEDFIEEVGPPPPQPPPADSTNNGEDESVDDKGDQGHDEVGEKQEINENNGDGGDSWNCWVCIVWR